MYTDSYGNTRFPGVYRGLVAAVGDPLNKGRVKLQIPQILGDSITDWAWGSYSAGVETADPEVGTGVWVQFEGGDPSYPLWSDKFDSSGSVNYVQLNPAYVNGSPPEGMLTWGTLEGIAAKNGTVTSVGTGTGLTGGPFTTSGTVSLASLSPNPANTYGSATAVPVVTVDAYGRVTAVSNTPIVYPSHNYIINGAFDFWQRGTTSSTSAVYIADRWLHSQNDGTLTVSRSTDVPVATLPYSLSYECISGTTPQIQQRIEAINALPLVGQVVTFSIWAKSTVGTSALAWRTAYPTTTADTFFPNTTDQSGTFEETMTVGTWTRYSATFTVSANAVRGYTVIVSRTTTTASTTTLYAGAQLEIGSVATPFRRNAPSIQAELAACQRYYEKTTEGNSGFSGNVTNTLSYFSFTKFQTAKRVAPTITTASVLHTGFSTGAATPGRIDQHGFYGSLVCNSSTNGAYFAYTWTANAEL